MITISFFKSKEQRKQKCNYYEKFKIIKGIRNKTVPPRNPSAGEGRKYNDLNSYLLGSQATDTVQSWKKSQDTGRYALFLTFGINLKKKKKKTTKENPH